MSCMKPIKELHRDDKPREKLVKKGVEALKNDELLSVLLGSGVQGTSLRYFVCKQGRYADIRQVERSFKAGWH